MELPKSAKLLDYSMPRETLAGELFKQIEIQPQGGQSSVTVTTAGGQTIQLSLQTGSSWTAYYDVLSYLMTPGLAGASRYNFLYNNLPFQSINLFDSATSTSLFQMDAFLQFYLDTVSQVAVHFSDYIQRGGARDGEGCLQAPINPSRYLGTTADTNGCRYNGTVLGYPLLERNYLIRSFSGVANTATPVVRVNFKLNSISHSWWSDGVTIPLANQLTLRLSFAPATSYGFTSTNEEDMTATPAAITNSVVFSDITYFQTFDETPSIITANVARMNQPNGFEVYSSYVDASSQNFTSVNSVSKEYKASAALGRVLNRIYTVTYPSTQTIQNTYNKSNVSGVKYSSYYTLLNSKRIQNQNIQVSTDQDWFMFKEKIDQNGCAILSVSDYKYNFFVCDVFSGQMINDVSLTSSGIPTNVEQTYRFQGTCPGSLSLNVYQFAVYLQAFRITKSGIFVSA